jgi:hypothetical protein
VNIGIDFDNTIVTYDELFFALARERGLIPPDFPMSKTRIRDHLRNVGQEPTWTELQGLAYGDEIGRARPFPGVLDFFRACRRQGIAVRIISHKTRRPYLGSDTDLHAAARGFLVQQGLSAEDAFFELTREAKLERIASTGCTHFVDDLPEFLTLAGFPRGVRRILFDPLEHHTTPPDIMRAASWSEIGALLLCRRLAA